MARFTKGVGNWTEYRKLGTYLEVDFHPPETHEQRHAEMMPYHERMWEVYGRTIDTLKQAQDEGYEYVIFTHGWSTSRPGQTTARSEVRKVMRSPEATPYIIRKDCIQHHSVFVAKIKPTANDTPRTG